MRGTEVSEFIDLAYTWQERAIKAEAEVERLYEINQGCESEARLYDDLLRRCRVENAQLRKVAEAARDIETCPNCDNNCRYCPNVDLEQALAELDKDGER